MFSPCLWSMQSVTGLDYNQSYPQFLALIPCVLVWQDLMMSDSLVKALLGPLFRALLAPWGPVDLPGRVTPATASSPLSEPYGAAQAGSRRPAHRCSHGAGGGEIRPTTDLFALTFAFLLLLLVWILLFFFFKSMLPLFFKVISHSYIPCCDVTHS